MKFQVLAALNGHYYTEDTEDTGRPAHRGTWQKTTGSCECGKWWASVEWWEEGPFDSRDEWHDHVLESVARSVRTERSSGQVEVVRVLVYRGTREWIEQSLQSSLVRPTYRPPTDFPNQITEAYLSVPFVAEEGTE